MGDELTDPDYGPSNSQGYQEWEKLKPPRTYYTSDYYGAVVTNTISDYDPHVYTINDDYTITPTQYSSHNLYDWIDGYPGSGMPFDYNANAGNDYVHNQPHWNDGGHDHDRYNFILEKRVRDYDNAIAYQKNLQSWSNYQAGISVFSNTMTPYTAYQQMLNEHQTYNTNLPIYNADLAVWNEYLSKSEYEANVTSWDNGTIVTGSYSSNPAINQLPMPGHNVNTAYQVALRHALIWQNTSVPEYNAELAMWLDYSNDIVFTLPHANHLTVASTAYQQLAESWQTYDSNILQYNNYVSSSQTVTSDGTPYQEQLLEYETYLINLAAWQQLSLIHI